MEYVQWNNVEIPYNLLARIFPEEIGDKVGEMSSACKTKHYSTPRARSCLMSALGWCLSFRVSFQKMTVFLRDDKTSYKTQAEKFP